MLIVSLFIFVFSLLILAVGVLEVKEKNLLIGVPSVVFGILTAIASYGLTL